MRGREPKAIPLDEAIGAAVKAYQKALVARTNVRIYNHRELAGLETFWKTICHAEQRTAKALELAERRVRRSADVEQERLLREKRKQ